MTCLKVSELNERAREALVDALGPDLWVVGEISGLKAHAKSGHLYFDLVEKPVHSSDQYIAKVSCAFFRGSLMAWHRSIASQGIQGFELSSGMEIKLRASVDLFVKEGRYQLIVSEIDPSYTFGAIARRRAQTIESLRASGLLEKNKALELSPIPLNIGLITSKGSAAYQDFTTIIMRSGFSFRITLFDAHMQGESTVKEVIRGIRSLEASTDMDAIVITRGGGAKTDLFVFDDINICRAIASCSRPVITGIGHEIDLSVADMVAHSSFVTPTDTARFLVSRVQDVWAFLEDAYTAYGSMAMRTMDMSSRELSLMANRLALFSQKYSSHARSALESVASAIFTRGLSLMAIHDRRLFRVASSINRLAVWLVNSQASTLDQTVLGLKLNSASLLKHLVQDLKSRQSFMLREISLGIAGSLKTLDHYEKALEVVHPRTTLQRGYSITLAGDGRVLRDAEDAPMEDRITTVLAKGKIHSVIYDKEQ